MEIKKKKRKEKYERQKTKNNKKQITKNERKKDFKSELSLKIKLYQEKDLNPKK